MPERPPNYTDEISPSNNIPANDIEPQYAPAEPMIQPEATPVAPESEKKIIQPSPLPAAESPENREDQGKRKIDVAFPENPKLVKLLRNELEECHKTHEKSEEVLTKKNPPPSPEMIKAAKEDFQDTTYKIAVFSELISRKGLNSRELLKKIKEEKGKDFDRILFDSAVDVADAYATGKLDELYEDETGLKNFEVKDSAGDEAKIEAQPNAEPTPEEIKKSREEKEKQLLQVVEEMNQFEKQGDERVSRLKMERAGELYETVTGEKLKQKSHEKARAELKEKGYNLVSPEDYRHKHMPQERRRVETSEQSRIIMSRWEILSEEEKAKYQSPKKFTGVMEERMDAKRNELSKKGIDLPANAFYAMMDRGLRPEDIKVRGFWGKLFHGGNDIEIPRMEKSKVAMNCSRVEFVDVIVKKSVKDFDDAVETETLKNVEINIFRGQEKVRETRQKCSRDILVGTIARIKEERRPKLEEAPIPKSARDLGLAKQEKKEEGRRRKPEEQIVREVASESLPPQTKSELKKKLKEVENKIKNILDARKEEQPGLGLVGQDLLARERDFGELKKERRRIKSRLDKMENARNKRGRKKKK